MSIKQELYFVLFYCTKTHTKALRSNSASSQPLCWQKDKWLRFFQKTATGKNSAGIWILVAYHGPGVSGDTTVHQQ